MGTDLSLRYHLSTQTLQLTVALADATLSLRTPGPLLLQAIPYSDDSLLASFERARVQ